ncbi:hypothetical protein V2J09_000802 [Rumex salicifolius]
MAQNSTARSNAYLTALTVEIEKKLQRAVVNPSLRRNLLQELFADVALEVDDRAKDMILSTSEDAISPEPDGTLCFYDVLSDHFVEVPEDGTPILDLIVKLWSQSFASQIFSLLFHKWESKNPCPSLQIAYCYTAFVRICISVLFSAAIAYHKLQLFEAQIESSEVLLRFSSALVQGATNIFWDVVYGHSIGRDVLSNCIDKHLTASPLVIPRRLGKIDETWIAVYQIEVEARAWCAHSAS